MRNSHTTRLVISLILMVVVLGLICMLTGCKVAANSYVKSFTVGVEYNDIRANAKWDYGQSGKRVVRAQK